MNRSIFESMIGEMIGGILNILVSLTIVIIPLMILLEILLKYKILERFTNKMDGLGKLLGIQSINLLPMIIGVIIGITYSAGTMMTMQKEREIPKREVFLMCILIFGCHALIETTLIFAAIGANFFMICFGQLGIAFLITVVAARIVK